MIVCWFGLMPRNNSDLPHAPIETPAGLRTMAEHARRLARNVGDREAEAKLTEFAEELEAKAVALETATQTFSHDDAAAIQQIEGDTDTDT